MSESSKTRQQDRTPIIDTLMSVILKPLGEEIEIFGLVSNKSGKGMRVTIPLELEPETQVEITVTAASADWIPKNSRIVGVVRWCEESETTANTYDVGIEMKNFQENQQTEP